MKFNYPIKYAAMPIKDCDMTYYIVSKCYLINDTTKYDSCGYSYKDSEVVFPYELTEHEKWERVNPKFSCLGYCTNSNKVDDLFDTYEEALKFVATKNEESFVKIWECVPFTSNLLERINKARDEFDAKLLEYKVLEQKIMD